MPVLQSDSPSVKYMTATSTASPPLPYSGESIGSVTEAQSIRSVTEAQSIGSVTEAQRIFQKVTSYLTSGHNRQSHILGKKGEG